MTNNSDLDSDPEELFNLAEEGEWQEQLAVWRGRMVEQLSCEAQPGCRMGPR